MEQIGCDTIKDLFPMYIEKMTSEASNRIIEEHVEGCGECREVLEQMREPIETEKAPEVIEIKKYLRKSKMSIFFGAMGIIAFISILSCFIVNLAVEGRLTWFYIVAAGLLTAYWPGFLLLGARTHRVVKALAALNLCTVILLAVIQAVTHYLMGIGGIWFFSIAMPITLLWSAAIWAGVACNRFLHVNALISTAIFLFLSIGGNYFTNIISDGYQYPEEYMANFVSNAAGFALVGFICLIVGIIRQITKKQAK